MSDSELGIGVVGTGGVAGAHIENWKRVAGAEIVAIASRRRERAAAKAAAHGVQATPYGALEALLADNRVHVVTLCTPHAEHPEQAIACAEAGKHVVIEKPVALDRRNLARMLGAVERAGVRTSVCFELHWIGSFQATRRLIEAGRIGTPFYGEAGYYHGIGPDNPQFQWGHHTPAGGGSAMLTAGCHALDGLIHLMNDRVSEVTAFANTSPANAYGYAYAPNVQALLRFASGAIGKVGVSLECRNPYHFPVMIQGEQGTIRDNRLWSTDLPEARTWIELPVDVPGSGDVADHPFLGQFREFAECLRAGRDPHNNLAAAAHVHDVCFAIDDAVAAGGAPTPVTHTPPEG